MFIRETIVENNLTVNPLENTYSIVKTIVQQFKDFGWTVTEKPNPHDKGVLHELVSPGGLLKLSMRGGKVYRHSGPTESICRHKNLTKIMLDLDNVAVPKGADFLKTQRAIALSYFRKLPKPVVVKPTDAAGSRGVTVGVRDAKVFIDAWEIALAEARENSKILVEQFIPGVELRAYVVGNTAVSVVARVQPYVIGDGKAPLTRLIEKLHEERSVNFRAKNYGINIDWPFIASQGLHKSSVPDEDGIVFLNTFTIGAVGGLAVDVTDLVSNEIKEVAVKAKNAVPGLEVAGVDILTDNVWDAKTAYVLEINTAASPDLHRYATHGTTRNVHEDVVRYFHDEYLKLTN